MLPTLLANNFSSNVQNCSRGTTFCTPPSPGTQGYILLQRNTKKSVGTCSGSQNSKWWLSYSNQNILYTDWSTFLGRPIRNESNFDFQNKFQQTSFPGVFLWERVTSDRIYPWVPEDGIPPVGCFESSTNFSFVFIEAQPNNRLCLQSE